MNLLGGNSPDDPLFGEESHICQFPDLLILQLRHVFQQTNAGELDAKEAFTGWQRAIEEEIENVDLSVAVAVRLGGIRVAGRILVDVIPHEDQIEDTDLTVEIDVTGNSSRKRAMSNSGKRMNAGEREGAVLLTRARRANQRFACILWLSECMQFSSESHGLHRNYGLM